MYQIRPLSDSTIRLTLAVTSPLAVIQWQVGSQQRGTSLLGETMGHGAVCASRADIVFLSVSELFQDNLRIIRAGRSIPYQYHHTSPEPRPWPWSCSSNVTPPIAPCLDDHLRGLVHYESTFQPEYCQHHQPQLPQPQHNQHPQPEPQATRRQRSASSAQTKERTALLCLHIIPQPGHNTPQHHLTIL